jgi:hypothetical protein
VAALTGCGSASASLIGLRRDAGVVCRHTNRAFRHLPSLPSQGQAASFLRFGIGRLTRELSLLRGLHPPRDVADVYLAGLSALGHELSVLRTAVTGIHRGQDPGIAFRTLGTQITPLESQANGAWQALQIPACLQ